MKLVIVDDVDVSLNSIAARLKERGVDAVSLDLDPQVEQLADAIADLRPDCVLLDFVLTESGQVRFRSHVLARVLRDRAIDGSGPEIPIVLYSSAPKFKSFYEIDQTSHDLYDFRFDKDDMQSDIELALRILNALAAAYEVLSRGERNRSALLTSLRLPEGVELDPRVGDRFTNIRRHPIAELVGYLIREVIEQPYPLVNKALLCARLGLDLGTSPGAEELFASIPVSARYSGMCSGGFERWWWEVVEAWLNEMAEGSFRSLTAVERLEVLKRHTKIEHLIPAAPIEDDYETAYWTCCEAYHRPLDLANAFIASNSSREPWHDHRYLSLDAALRQRGEESGIVVDAVDEERFRQVREQRAG